MPPARFQHGFANDVFISYAHQDDYEEAGFRWVSQFESQLKSRLAKVSGKPIEIWRDGRLTAADRFSREIQSQLLNSAVLVPIVTPCYFGSDWCDTEREEFIRSATVNRGLDVGNKARIVKVAKTRVDLAQYPEQLRELLEFRFYIEEQNGTAREFHLSPDPHVQKLLHPRIDDVAQEIAEILRRMDPGTTRPAKGVVYLGETSRDIDVDRDQLRRSLVNRGYEVLPLAPLRLRSGPEVEQVVQRDLARCNLAVYPVGAYYGPIPERSGNLSITELQLETALRDSRDGMLWRMVWVPPGLDITEDRQKNLLTRIRMELPGKGFEIIERPLTEIETHIGDRFEQIKPIAAAASAQEPLEIYVMCLPGDRNAVRAIRDNLFGRGYEVKLPPSGTEAVGPIHSQRLETASAFLIFYGGGDEAWLERMLSELKKAKGLRKGALVLSRAIYLADPITEDKGDFMTHQAMVLQGFSPTPVEEALGPFVAEIERGRKAGAP